MDYVSHVALASSSLFVQLSSYYWYLSVSESAGFGCVPAMCASRVSH